MSNSDRNHMVYAQALRQEALMRCLKSGWSPKCIGNEKFQIGIVEIYEEIRCLQEVHAVDISQELVECCRRHKQWSPLLDDVEARIALFRGDYGRAEVIWLELLHHPNAQLRSIATKALHSISMKQKSGESLFLDVLNALDRNRESYVFDLLTDAVMKAIDLKDQFLLKALDAAAMSRQKPEHWPLHRELLINQLVMELFSRQLSAWEDNVN